MTDNAATGAVDALWRFPVKSMLGERLEQAEFTATGIVGDRAWALIEVETGRVVSAKSVKRFPDLLGCRAAFVDAPRPGEQLPAVRIELPDGAVVRSDAEDADAALSAFFGVEVTLARSAPEDFTVDQYHPDLEKLDPFGNRNTVVQQKLGAALFAEMGMDSPVPAGSFMDVCPVSLITTSTMDRLAEIQPASRFDARRFRMNLTVATAAPGLVENEWIGRPVVVGDGVQLHVALPTPRCVMTTLAQQDLPADHGILRTLVQHNPMDVAGAGNFPCAGVYAVVAAPGRVRLGDAVVVG